MGNADKQSNLLRVTEVFYSLQGEGSMAGVPAVFVRLAGCNLNCRLATHGFDCDTDHRKVFTADPAELVRQVGEYACKWVVLTGGEPTIQDVAPLVKALRLAGYAVALETNGTTEVHTYDFDFIACSPKLPTIETGLIKLRMADDVRVVLGAGQRPPNIAALPGANRYYLSPAASGDHIDEEAMSWCVKQVLEKPEWRLGMQQHKVWRVR